MFTGNLENRIENVVELSSVCRGEWCRALESRVDSLQEELESAGGEREFAEMQEKIREAYRLLGPDIHI